MAGRRPGDDYRTRCFVDTRERTLPVRLACDDVGLMRREAGLELRGYEQVGEPNSGLRLSRREARLIVVAAQGLARRAPRRRIGKADILAETERLGCVQLDSISVVSRSHETVLWSRLGIFDPTLIGELYDPDHALSEYLVHAAAIVPVTRLPLF